MTSLTTIIEHKCGRKHSGFLSMLIIAFLSVCGAASAQLPGESHTHNSLLDTIPEEAMAVFNRYVQGGDTAKMAYVNMHRRDRFVKRFNVHTNMVDWVTLVPNIGIEFDLNGSSRNNYSVSLFCKFNGSCSHGSFVYNVNALRVEGRKYWRTGKYGKRQTYYDNFEKIYTDTASLYYNADSLAGYSYYVDTLGRSAKALGIKMESIRAAADMTQEQRDALDFADDSLGIRKHRLRGWYYNTYNKVRRNVTSGRTLENPRNWRAYYAGLWAGTDNWSISFNGNGIQGKGIGLGLVFGYTLPLLPQSYPREGSFDLDLGLSVGWKAVKYDAYVYEEQTQHYVYDYVNSCTTLKIVPYPIIQDLHVSLVWRFRGIKSKVDKSLIDEYEKKWVVRYIDRRNAADTKYTNIVSRRKALLEALQKRSAYMSDSAGVWDDFNRRRIDAAMRLNPDTVFSGRDLQDYLRIFKGLKSDAEQLKYKKSEQQENKREAKAMEAMNRKAAKALADSLKAAHRDSVKNATKKHHVVSTAAIKDSLIADSVVTDTVPVLPDDSIQAGVPVPVTLEEQPEQTPANDSIPVINPQTLTCTGHGKSESEVCGEDANETDRYDLVASYYVICRSDDDLDDD